MHNSQGAATPSSLALRTCSRYCRKSARDLHPVQHALMPSLPAFAGIIRRVALVLLLGVGIGTALFFIGLEYMFPKY